MSQATCEFRRVLEAVIHFGNRLRTSSAGTVRPAFASRMPLVDGGERFLVFLVQDGSRTLEFELFRLRHRLIVGWNRWAVQRNSLPVFPRSASLTGSR